MDEFKYLIYCLHKSTHVGYVFSLKHHNKSKQPFIFVDEAVWSCKASSRSGISGSPSSVWSCFRAGMGSLGQWWLQDLSVPAVGWPLGAGAQHKLLTSCLGRAECCQLAAGATSG